LSHICHIAAAKLEGSFSQPIKDAISRGKRLLFSSVDGYEADDNALGSLGWMNSSSAVPTLAEAGLMFVSFGELFKGSRRAE
jgi:hypothetical protein